MLKGNECGNIDYKKKKKLWIYDKNLNDMKNKILCAEVNNCIASTGFWSICKFRTVIKTIT